MNDIQMTLVGNVCDEPQPRVTKSGVAVTKLRVASTPRHFDRNENRWVDGETLFLDVTCWRALAERVAESVHKGQPVVVTGRFTAHTYEINEQLRYAFGLEATSVGHDLSRGTAEFRKAQRASAPSHVPADETGAPVDATDRWLVADSGPLVPLSADGAAPSAEPDFAAAG